MTGAGARCAVSMSKSPKPNRRRRQCPGQTQPLHPAVRATKSVNRTLEAKTRALAGWKGDTTNLFGHDAYFVIDAYHQLWRIEKAFRTSKHDLQARPI